MTPEQKTILANNTMKQFIEFCKRFGFHDVSGSLEDGSDIVKLEIPDMLLRHFMYRLDPNYKGTSYEHSQI